MCSNFTTTQSVYANEELIDMTKIEKVLNSYMEIDEHGNRWFNYEVAKENNVSEDALNAGKMFNIIAVLHHDSPKEMENFLNSVNSDINPEDYPYLYYGEWCGPGTVDNNQYPIDVLDRMCQIHDRCYSSRGYGDSWCDNNFVNNLKANMNSIKSLGARAYVYAQVAILYFS